MGDGIWLQFGKAAYEAGGMCLSSRFRTEREAQ